MRRLLRAGLMFVAIAAPIHLLYTGVIRPRAEEAIEAARETGQSAPRDLVVILKDWEQEICMILTVFCACLILGRLAGLASRQYLFTVDLLKEADTGEAPLSASLDELERLPRDVGETPLVETLKASLRRYRITGDVQDTSDAITTSVEALGMRLEAENAMIRYMIWAIPSIGFIGTVRGIGQALSQADRALAGDIASMTASLGLAFNSTLVALIASIVLMLLLHVLQRSQDKLLVDTRAYCEEFLLKRISR